MSVRRALALAAALPLLLAGCSDDEPEPKMPDPPPSSSSSSSTPIAEPPKEQESPEEFIRRWVQVGDEMQQTGEVAEFRRLSRNCQACAQVVDQVRTIYAGGGSIEFAGSQVSLLKRVAPDPPTFHLNLSTPETVIRNAAGAVDQRLPSGEGLYLVILNGRPGAWHVANYARR